MGEDWQDAPPPLTVTVAGEEQSVHCKVGRWDGPAHVLLRPDEDAADWLGTLQPGEQLKVWWVTTQEKPYSATVVVKAPPEAGSVAVSVIAASEQQRRSATRFEVTWPVSIAALQGLLPDVIETETADVSFHGMSIREVDLQTGDGLAVAIWLPEQGPVLGVAEVRRVIPQAGRAGLQITQLTEQHKSRLAQELWNIQRKLADLA